MSKDSEDESPGRPTVEELEDLVDRLGAQLFALGDDVVDAFRKDSDGKLASMGLGEHVPPEFAEKFSEVMAFRRRLTDETDLGVALASRAYLEDQLGVLLRKLLVPDDKIHKDMFEGTGPLATFSARISMSFCLGQTSRSTTRDLHLIRRIANEFAHDPRGISFADEKIANRCRDLETCWLPSSYAPRTRFVTTVVGILARIHTATRDATTFTTKDERPLPSPDLLHRGGLASVAIQLSDGIERALRRGKNADSE